MYSFELIKDSNIIRQYSRQEVQHGHNGGEEIAAFSSGKSSAYRKFYAENANMIRLPVSESEIVHDLKKLENDPTQLKKLISDLKKDHETISTYRTSNGRSLIDLCGQLLLPKSALAILNYGFEFTVNSEDGVQTDLSPRYQWRANHGYCGETSIISAGLANGEYISQFDARSLATNLPQDSSELLLGDGSDLRLAKAMHLDVEEYPNENEVNPKKCLDWMKSCLAKGYQVTTGVYMNESIFGESGDKTYDHIVSVIGFGKDAQGNETIQFSDHGLYGEDNPTKAPYIFSYPVKDFLANRNQANQGSNPYYFPDQVANFAVAVKGIKGDAETVPVHLLTSVNDEIPEMKDGNQRPIASTITLTPCITGLKPGVTYNLYEYDDLSKVPNSHFNAHASQAVKCYKITITSGNSYVIDPPIQIQSDQQIAFRCVPSSGP